MQNNYLQSAKQQFTNYKLLAEKTFQQLSDEQLFWQFNEASNSISVIVKHMRGNMLSRWTDFLTTDGEKEWRQRDAEFENDLKSREALMQKWEEGWACLFAALHSLTTEDLSKEIFIRAQPLSVVEAINRQLTHYAYHVGQIVFLGKMLCNDKWQTLSIAKGNSTTYNAELYSGKVDK